MTAETDRPRTVLVIGSTGSIGRLVVEEAAHAGYRVRPRLPLPGSASAIVASVSGMLLR
jgi:NAD(P)-dependent dehydrogenase (short-subunit alcohol dehydrogenase family)